MTTNILRSVLEEINLSSFSIEVYLKCIEIPEPNISRVAESLAVDRTKVYTAMEELTAQGLVTPKETYGREIMLEPPAKLIARLRDKEIRSKRLLEDLTQLLPDISAQYHWNKRRPYLKSFEGRGQFIEVFNQALNDADTTFGIKFFGNTDSFYDIIGFQYHLEWTQMRIQRGIPATILCFPSTRLAPLLPDNEAAMRCVKWLPSDFSCEGSYYLYGNSSVHWNPLVPKAVLIEDAVINATLNTSFETIWAGLPDAT